MTPTAVSPDAARIYFLNRDHIVLVTNNDTELIVITSVGSKIKIPCPPATLAKFRDELTNDVQSNFAAVASFGSASVPELTIEQSA